jgi:hypothetical protein
LVDPWKGIVRSGSKREARKGRTDDQFLFLHKAHGTAKVASSCINPDESLLQFITVRVQTRNGAAITDENLLIGTTTTT